MERGLCPALTPFSKHTYTHTHTHTHTHTPHAILAKYFQVEHKGTFKDVSLCVLHYVRVILSNTSNPWVRRLLLRTRLNLFR